MFTQSQVTEVADFGTALAATTMLAYDGMDNVTAETNATAGGAYKFDGMRFDAETGDYSTWARTDAPGVGRWMQQDSLPLLFAEPDSYRLVANSPTNAIDPEGRWQIDVHFYMTYYLACAVGLQRYNSWISMKEGKGAGLFKNDNASEALATAYGDQQVDDNPNTEPIQLAHRLLFGAFLGGLVGALYDPIAKSLLEQYHFPVEPGASVVIPDTGRANAVLNEALRIGGSSLMFGIGLHRFQDSWSHAGFSAGGGGHLAAWEEPDIPSSWRRSKAWPENRVLVLAMAKRTYERLCDYQRTNHPKAKVLKTWKEIEPTVQRALLIPGRSLIGRVDYWKGLIGKDFGIATIYNPHWDTGDLWELERYEAALEDMDYMAKHRK